MKERSLDGAPSIDGGDYRVHQSVHVTALIHSTPRLHLINHLHRLSLEVAIDERFAVPAGWIERAIANTIAGTSTCLRGMRQKHDIFGNYRLAPGKAKEGRMPFVSARAPDEDGERDDDPPLDQYQYIPPPRFGGAPEPVRFSLEPPAPEPEPAEPPTPVELQPPVEHTPLAPAPRQRRSLLDLQLGGRPILLGWRLILLIGWSLILFGWWRIRFGWRRILFAWRRPAGSPQPTTRVYVTAVLQRQSERQREPAQRRQQLFAIAIPELQKAGVRRAYCRYDGGHDEGFAWPDYFEMQDGGRISPRDLAGRLRGAGLTDSAAGITNRHAFVETDLDALRRLCFEWASLLLGHGYGTGEYSMYGAFTVDLDACTITDDRIADPDGHRASKFG
jgi:hypothetical protein